MELTDRIDVVKGIGEKTEKLFAKLNIFTIEELLEHYPRGYETYGEILSVAQLKIGETAVIEASLVAAPVLRRVRGLTILTCRVRDGSGDIMLTWFNMPFLKNTLKPGVKYLFRGMISRKNGSLTMEQPKILTKEEYFNRKNLLQPIYPLTQGLTNHAVTKAVGQALKETDLTGDYLPYELRRDYNLMDRKAALKEIHFPKGEQTMLAARRRIVFDEFFLFSLAMNQLKTQKEKKVSSFVMKPVEECRRLVGSLPYQLTNAQKKVWQDLQQDFQSGTVANRLIQGDVGSGKTILAILALLMAVKNGFQGALMVPTEVLAQQHFENVKHALEPFGVHIGLLCGSMTAKEKRTVYEGIREQNIDIVIGTHALIQEKVEYKRLGLVITDEQHRFGVRQRQQLAEKGEEPHILVMSATPIPRTLAIILYGDLDLSVLDELPANRLPIKNCVVNENYRPTAYKFIEKETAKGHQAYIICPMVEESENIEAENVIDYTENLRTMLPPYLVVEYLHGKMKPKEKNEIMERFASGEIQVLVSTTVVEVGVDVKNATVMMIENAERFGLAQLHQLRGRVGRGKDQSYCILMSNAENRETKKRLEIMNQSNDGFFIAGEDLKLRGPGDLFGIRQSGMLEFKMADIFNDAAILKEAALAAGRVSEKDIGLMLKKHTGLKNKLLAYGTDLSL
ncbi:ATP-dependent DNA helicase RecG [Acetivibrio ethanolgignens]|uniref:ATP-dependent DNA helicase RecG n=1 Tax=Acetivibrio ethanolgignens TaxID=290052 RepID=A0A0V8QG91_9FIRM|nr:ATP-dependent DNA helicase RecG [Acetivibrio ethanolgignens]KSV59536.1 ATP-dependent DNA helicase RecG [Acetivibrio ethanolgignens]